MDTMPSDHQCTNDYFVLKSSITDKQRDRYYSMLLTARTTGTTLTVGYDKINPDCSNDRPVVHALTY